MQKIEFYQTESGCKGPYSKGKESYSSAKGRNTTEVQEKGKFSWGGWLQSSHPLKKASMLTH